MIARIIAIVVIGMAVNIYIPIAPSILGAWVDYQGMTMDVAGRLTSYDFWGSTVGSILAVFLLHRPGWNLRATAAVCLLLAITTSGASVWLAGNIPALVIVRFANGIGSGLGFTAACVAVIGTPRIERTYAILYGSPFLISGIGLALLPMAYRALGIGGAFYGMGLINALALLLLPFFPKTVEHTEGQQRAAAGPLEAGAPWLALLALTGLLLHYVFNSGIWAYFERLGVAAGMTPETTGAILGPSMAAAIFGMIAASFLGDRWGYMRPIYFGIAGITVSTVALLGASSELLFGVATAVFNASITFVTPYMVAILALLIPSGLGVTTANVATIAGFSTGPWLISFLVAGGAFTAAIFVTTAGFIFVLLLFVLFVRLLGQTPGFDRLKAQCLRLTPAAGDASRS
jgi:Major Facilitator Superfamily